MPHISRKKLKKKVFAKIGAQLADAINKAGSPEEIHWFLNELLTPTERIMLSKRLALIFLLEKGYSFRAIQKILKVTPQTVLRFWKKTKKPSYRTEIKKISSSKSGKNFWEELEELLTLGLPPKIGPGRWRTAESVFSKLSK